jgi:hypothetical protein
VIVITLSGFCPAKPGFHGQFTSVELGSASRIALFCARHAHETELPGTAAGQQSCTFRRNNPRAYFRGATIPFAFSLELSSLISPSMSRYPPWPAVPCCP